MKKTILTLALGLMFSGQGAFALTADEVVNDLRQQGYTRTEVRVGPNQIKVEAIRGSEKLEVIYDKSSGAVLKSEVATVRFGDNTTPGVSVRDRSRDFVRLVAGTHSSSDDSSNGASNNSRNSASSDDNGEDHARSDSNSGDTSSDDDHGSGRGSDDSGNHDENDDHGQDDGNDSNEDHGSDS